jgi:outer membrane lipoprotein-sorting protein
VGFGHNPPPVFKGLLALAFLVNFGAFAQTPKAAPATEISSDTRLVLKSISERYRKLKAWSADFSQETFSMGLGRGTFQKGAFRFSNPNKIYYSLEEPDASTFVSNGTEAWLMKFPKGLKKPADVTHFQDVARIELDRYLIFLRGVDTLDKSKEAQLIKEYKVSSKTTPAEIILTLEPRKSSEVVQVDLHFSQSEIPPKKVVITDALGNTTTVVLVKPILDAKFGKDDFVAKIPRGSKVTEQ